MRNTSAIGNIGQAKISAKFIELGINIFSPVGEGYTTDLIAEFNGKLNKIQIKTTEFLHEDSYMIWWVTHQEGNHGKVKKYTPEEVDYFALYCIATGTMYLVPYTNALTQRVIIRLDSYKGRRNKTMKFESEYLFENFITF
jgi:hypothetical protein